MALRRFDSGSPYERHLAPPSRTIRIPTNIDNVPTSISTNSSPEMTLSFDFGQPCIKWRTKTANEPSTAHKIPKPATAKPTAMRGMFLAGNMTSKLTYTLG